MSKVIIVGYGVVGKNMRKELDKLNPVVYDKKMNERPEQRKFEFGFICVDTPLKDGRLDTSQVELAIAENNCDVYVVKSTVPVGWTEQMVEKTGKRIVVNPEYYGETQHCLNYNFDFTILGGDKKTCIEVIQLMQEVYDARHTFKVVESKVAEMAKLMENSFLATKVTFCNQFFVACEKQGIDYEDVRECFVLDERCGKSHTFVYREHPYYDTHCMNKDIPEAMNSMDMDLMKAVYGYNEKLKKRYTKR